MVLDTSAFSQASLIFYTGIVEPFDFTFNVVTFYHLSIFWLCTHMHHTGAGVGMLGVAAVAAGIISRVPDTSSGSTNVAQRQKEEVLFQLGVCKHRCNGLG